MFSKKSKETFSVKGDVSSSFHPFEVEINPVFLTYAEELIILSSFRRLICELIQEYWFNNIKDYSCLILTIKIFH